MGTFVNLPRRCLVVEPNVRRGESPFVVSGVVPDGSSKEVVQLADRLQKFGIPTPWRNSPYVDLKEFEGRILLEIPKVADFVEKELALVGKPSFGVEVSHARLELPLMEDRDGPGQGVYSSR